MFMDCNYVTYAVYMLCFFCTILVSRILTYLCVVNSVIGYVEVGWHLGITLDKGTIFNDWHTNCTFWGFHGGDCSDCDHLGCDALEVSLGGYRCFGGTYFLHLQGWNVQIEEFARLYWQVARKMVAWTQGKGKKMESHTVGRVSALLRGRLWMFYFLCFIFVSVYTIRGTDIPYVFSFLHVSAWWGTSGTLGLTVTCFIFLLLSLHCRVFTHWECVL
jgi:hypothetical protein